MTDQAKADARPTDPLRFERAISAWMADELIFPDPVRAGGTDAMPVFAQPMSQADRLLDRFESLWQAEHDCGLIRIERMVVLGYLCLAAERRRWLPTLSAGGAVGRAELWLSAMLRGDRGTLITIDEREGVPFDAALHVDAVEQQASEQAGAGA